MAKGYCCWGYHQSLFELFNYLFIYFFFFLCIHLSFNLSSCVSSDNASIYLCIYLSTFLANLLFDYLFVCPSFCLFIYLSTNLSIYLLVFLFMFLCIYLIFDRFIFLSLLAGGRCICLRICLSIHQFVYLCVFFCFYSPTAKLAMGSLAQNSSGAIRCSCNTRFRRRFRRVLEGSGADGRCGSGGFRRVPVQMADGVPEGSGADC